MLRPVLLAGCLLGLMSVVDTLAYGVRTAGVLTRKLAISISLFNILVIVSRLSNMFSAPILGNFPDKVYQGLYSVSDVRAALTIDLWFVIGGVLIGAMLMPTQIQMFKRGIQVLEEVGTLPKTIVYGLRHLREIPRHFRAPKLAYLREFSDIRVLPYQFLIYNVFVTCFYSIGVMSTVLAASIDHSVAGTAILLSGIVNGIATMTLFIIVDPPAAVVVENCISGTRPVSHVKTMNVALTATRLLGCLLALVLLPWMAQYVLAAAHWVDRNFAANRSVLVGQAAAQCDGLDYDFRLIQQASGEYHFELRIHNNQDKPHSMTTSSSQLYDFAVYAGKDRLWTSSAGLRYTQALETHSLSPHQSLKYTATWDGVITDPLSSGAIRAKVIARHLLMPEPVALEFSTTLRPKLIQTEAGPGSSGDGS